RRESDVGQYRVADLAIEAGDLGLDVLGRTNVGTESLGVFGELVEKSGVDIVANAEGEYPCVRRVVADHVFDDLFRLHLADGWLAVREEYDGKRPALVLGPHLERRVESRLDGGAAARLEAIHPFLGVIELLGVRFHQRIAIGADIRTERDDREAVARIEVTE